MTTVVFTDTHAAHDHCVVSMEKPMTNRVDMEHRKIFISPDHRFMIGISGIFNPAQVDTPRFYESVEQIIQFIFDRRRRDHTKSSVLMAMQDGAPLVYVKRRVQLDGVIFVTKDHRFKLKKFDDRLHAISIGDMVSLGSGGPFAIGMLLGGMDINSEELWENVHQLDYQSSVAHTVYDLSILEPWEKPIVEEDA